MTPQLDHCGSRSPDGDFNPSQSSQLFFSICFAIPVGGVFLLMADALGNRRLANLAPAFLGLTLIFLTWHQFSTYYIPLQYYRRQPETLVEEVTTFLVTVVLSGITVVSPSHPRFVLPLILFLLFLNARKVKEMIGVLAALTPAPQKSIAELKRFKGNTWFYFWAAGLLLVGEFLYVRKLGKSHVLLVGALPLPVYFVAAFLRGLWQTKKHGPALPWHKYNEELRSAFRCRSDCPGESRYHGNRRGRFRYHANRPGKFRHGGNRLGGG